MNMDKFYESEYNAARERFLQFRTREASDSITFWHKKWMAYKASSVPKGNEVLNATGVESLNPASSGATQQEKARA